MAALAMENYIGTPDELLERARQVFKTPESAALMLAAVNTRLAELAPGEEPYAAAKRLSVEWDDLAIEAGYYSLLWYYKDSLSPQKFSISYEEIDHEEYMGAGETVIRILKNRNE